MASSVRGKSHAAERHRVTVDFELAPRDVLNARRTAPEAGVHLICASLELLGFSAQPTSRNTKGVDAVVLNPENGRTASLQVKTKTQSKSTSHGLWWKVDLGGLKPIADYFVFVHLPQDNATASFCVDSAADVKKNVVISRRALNARNLAKGKMARADKNYGWHRDRYRGTPNSWDAVVEYLGR